MNHCNDINAVISAMTLGGLDRKGVLVSNRTAIEGTADLEKSEKAYLLKQEIERNRVYSELSKENDFDCKGKEFIHFYP